MRVELPSGACVQARGWSRLAESGDPDPEWGLYLDEGWRRFATWPHVILRWPDFGVPSESDQPSVFAAITDAWDRMCAGRAVEVGCTGGTGRTGTVLACFAVLDGLGPLDAIEWVRSDYNPHAIETREQEHLVAVFASTQGVKATDRSFPSDRVDDTSHDVGLLREGLRSDFDRWASELENWRGERATLWYGILDRACKHLERLTGSSIRRVLSVVDYAVRDVVNAVAQGRSIDRLTFGQHIDILRSLDRRRLISPTMQLLSKSDNAALDRVVRTRNDFEHGRLTYDDRALERTIQFLIDGRAVCDSRLLDRVSEM